MCQCGEISSDSEISSTLLRSKAPCEQYRGFSEPQGELILVEAS